MPGLEHDTSMLKHNCSEIIDLVYSSKPDLKDSPNRAPGSSVT